MSHDASATPIAICFAEHEITALFAALIEARGGTPTILTQARDLQQFTKIVTEPRYLPHVSPEHYGRCVVVGNTDAIPTTNTIALSRPLTESKVERAIAMLLREELVPR